MSRARSDKLSRFPLACFGPSASSGVSHEPKSLSDVRSADARSAQIRRPDGVSLRFQVSRNSVEPCESILRRNLLSKDHWRAALSDEPKPRRPEMTGICEALAFAGCGEGLAGARARPNKSLGPSCELEGQVPSADPGEEVAAVVAMEVGGLNFADVSLVNESGGDEPGSDEPSEPVGSECVVLVVVGIQRDAPCSFSSSPGLWMASHATQSLG